MTDAALTLDGVIVVMGVSGCGKSSVGEGIAAHLAGAYVEADDLHPASNKQKMSEGTPLTDEDRMPWLHSVTDTVKSEYNQQQPVVVACSALKKSYRDILRLAHPVTRFVFLSGDRSLILERMRARKGHFMPVSLLDSQFDTLENPLFEPGVVEVPIHGSVDAIVADAVERLLGLRS